MNRKNSRHLRLDSLRVVLTSFLLSATITTHAFQPSFRQTSIGPSISNSKIPKDNLIQYFYFSQQRRKAKSELVHFSESEASISTESNDGGVKTTTTNSTTSQLDDVLSKLTNAFPLFVLFSAILGMNVPSTLQWVNRGSLISLMLALVMMGTGMTLERKDFTDVIATDNWIQVPTGVLCQFLIMPAAAALVGRSLLLPCDPTHGPTLFLGLALVGCSPGGTASNLVSLIAGANVALSVLLTACSTLLASFVTPLAVQLLVGSTVRVSGWTLCVATARVVLTPVLLGMILNAKAPNLSKSLSRFTPFASVLLVSIICGGVVAQNASSLVGIVASKSLVPRIVVSVLALHALGFGVGYFIPKKFLKDEQTARTTSIETGMQNSALAVVLARSLGAPAFASLPGALSATAHSCLGSMLAAYWRLRQTSMKDDES